MDGLNLNGTAMGTTPCAIGTCLSAGAPTIILFLPTVRCRLQCHVQCCVHCRRSDCAGSCLSAWFTVQREVNCCFVEFVDHHLVQPRAHTLVINSSKVSCPKHWKCGSGVDRCKVFVQCSPLLLSTTCASNFVLNFHLLWFILR